jgi:hypothetical protein
MPAFTYEAHKENRLRKDPMLLEHTSNHCYRHGFSEMEVTWVKRALLASGQIEEVRLCCAVLLDKVTFKVDSVLQIRIRSL